MVRLFALCALLGCAACGSSDCTWPWDWDWGWRENAPLCNPTERRDCTCNTGGKGQESCHADGLDYGPCTCTDESIPTDAGVDAVTGPTS
jgi:hypothetical protein